MAVSAMISDDPGVSRSEMILTNVVRNHDAVQHGGGIVVASRLMDIHCALVSPGAKFITIKTWVPSGSSGLRKRTGVSNTLANF